MYTLGVMPAAATQPEAQSLSQLRGRLLDEVMRQFRTTRNDILRYGVWNVRNLSDEEFNHLSDRKLFNYFRQDLLETRFLPRGRRVDIIQLWHWFDDQLSGVEPLLVDGQEVFLRIEDKDLDKVRKRIDEIRSFFPILRGDDIDAFNRAKFKLRRTVLRLTYDLHHLAKRLDKYRRNAGIVRASAVEDANEVETPPLPAEELETHETPA